MVNPLIIPAGKAAVAAKGAAAGAAKIALSEKAAKGVGSAFKSIEETTKMGGFQNLENFSENLKQMGPVASAFEILGAQWTAGTMESQIGLMSDLLTLFTSEGGQSAIGLATTLFSTIINGVGALTRVLDKILNIIMGDEVEGEPTGLETGGGGDPYWVQRTGTRSGVYDINALISDAIYQAAVDSGGQLPQF